MKIIYRILTFIAQLLCRAGNAIHRIVPNVKKVKKGGKR